jgi:hypothetical protein
MAEADLARRARAVLDENRREGWTCPSRELYPHQWLWDSCFTAIGLAHYDPERAADELRALFTGQWSNGMLPHMIFAKGVRDVGSERIWQSSADPRAPKGVATSCITQPPLTAVAAWRVAHALPARERREFLAELLPKLVEYHRWLYRERDLEHRGLITLIHPWECGLDTTPPWMEALARMPAPWWLRIALRLRLARIVRFFRRDTRFAPEMERPSDDDGLRMLALVHRAKRHHFDLSRMPRHRSVLIEDVAFNALLAVANRSLTHIAGEVGVALDDDLVTCFASTRSALEELWDETTGQYYSRDAVTGELLAIPTVATFLVLWAETPARSRVERLLFALQKPGFWPRHPVPSVPIDTPHFDEDRYWKGPTWVNINWAIVEGLRAQGEHAIADTLRLNTLDLVDRVGFSEYFSAITGIGYGADDFSWTAALVLDLLHPVDPG